MCALPIFTLVARSRQLHSDALGEGDVDAAGERPGVIIAVAHIGIGRKIIARLGGHKVDRARYGVLAEQGALRRSEEHTSELQSLMRISYAVFCLKKKTQLTENKIVHV